MVSNLVYYLFNFIKGWGFFSLLRTLKKRLPFFCYSIKSLNNEYISVFLSLFFLNCFFSLLGLIFNYYRLWMRYWRHLSLDILIYTYIV